MSKGRSAKIYIVLGLYEPDLSLFERQLASVLAQTHVEFELIIACDGPAPSDARALIEHHNDGRLHVLQFSQNVGVHANYARGLSSALGRSNSDEDLFAFCDQDDVWMASKLAEQVEVLQNDWVALCHCDARIVDAAGVPSVNSMFAYEARSLKMGLQDLLIMNSVTGMTAVFRKDAAEAASAFPMAETPQMLHDHWVALVACGFGEVVFLNKPLVDYVQHASNELGASPPAQVGISRNLLFGGRSYIEKCRDQFAWRAKALKELEAVAETSVPAGLLSFRGLLRFCFQSLIGGNRRQADQAWRLVLGKMLSR